MTLDSWIATDGTVLPLDGTGGVSVLRGAAGLDVPPTDLTVEQRVSAAGAVLLNVREPARSLSLPIIVDLDVISTSEVAALFQPGGVLVSSASRELRELVYVSGLGGVWSIDSGGVTGLSHRKFPLEFLALDPWWYGEAIQESFVFGEPTAWDAAIAWDSAIPWNGGAAVSATITGDAPAFPLWTITGAATELIVSDGTSAWTWTRDLATGSYGTVDHRPGFRSPRLGSNLNGVEESGFGLWFLLSNDSTLDWGLPSGVNDVIVSVAGDDGSSALSLWYEPRWLTLG
jgi:hypothetical protein